MNPRKAALLAEVRPNTLVDADAPWQQRKSAEMRVRILEATIDCLVECGYAGLTIGLVTERAGVSRGAMHHHFPTREVLIGAVTEYVFYQRLERFLSDFADMGSGEGDDDAALAAATETHWRNVQSREYRAYLQLALAAMTDTDLARHFIPASQRFDAIWMAEMRRSFAQWSDRQTALQIANDFAMVAHMGLLIHLPIFEGGGRVEDVRALIGRVVGLIHKEDAAR